MTSKLEFYFVLRNFFLQFLFDDHQTARRGTKTNKFQLLKCLKFPSELFLYGRRDLRTSTKYFCQHLSIKHENKQTT